MSAVQKAIQQLAADPRWYSIGALTMTLRCDKRSLSRQIDAVVGVTLKQARYQHGFVYAHVATSDDAEVVYVRMTPQIAVDSYGPKNRQNNRK